MTYKDKIDQINGRVAKLYFEVEMMRDCSPKEDKFYWDKLRQFLFDADNPLSQLTNALPESRASINLKDLIK